MQTKTQRLTKSKKAHDRSIELMQFVLDFNKRTAFSPTIREIGEAVGLTSVATVHRYLINLRGLDLLSFIDNQPRTVAITENGIAYLAQHNKTNTSEEN